MLLKALQTLIESLMFI